MTKCTLPKYLKSPEKNFGLYIPKLSLEHYYNHFYPRMPDIHRMILVFQSGSPRSLKYIFLQIHILTHIPAYTHTYAHIFFVWICTESTHTHTHTHIYIYIRVLYVNV